MVRVRERLPAAEGDEAGVAEFGKDHGRSRLVAAVQGGGQPLAERRGSAACRQAALDHPRSTAALISFRSCRRAFLVTPWNRYIIGTDTSLAMTV